MRILEEIYNTIINEEIINEKLSYSEVVDNISQNILKEIQKIFWNCPKITIKKGLYLTKNQYTTNILDNKVTIFYQVYNFTDENVFIEKINDIDLTNMFEEQTLNLYISLIAINSNVEESLSFGNIVHEVEHLYQFLMSKNNNINFSSLTNGLLTVANKILNDEDKTYNDIDKNIANAIYYSNPHEQDAYIQEYYTEYILNKKDFLNNKTTIDERFEEYLNSIKNIKKIQYIEEFKKAIQKYSIYGLTENNIIKYFEKQLKRFNKKMNNIKKLTNLKMDEYKPQKPISENKINSILNKFKNEK